MDRPEPGSQAAHAAVVSRLARLAQDPVVAPGVAARAARMRAALDRPVRVTVFGLPWSGKSDVVNLLAGRRVLAGVPGLPTTEVVAGPDAATEITRADGQRITVPGLPDAAVAAQAPVLLRVTVPDAPGLARFGLLEVVSDGSAEDIAAAVRWAMPRTDIAVWCTARLTDADRAAWAAAPDAIKDHAVLVLTGANGPVPAGRPIRSGLPEGFRAAWPVWRARLGRALDAGDPADFAACGATALVAALAEIADAARSADVEAAGVFLARYAVPDVQADLPPAATGDRGAVGDAVVPVQEVPVPVVPVPVAAAAVPRPAAGLVRVPARVPGQALAAQRLLRDRAAALLLDVAPALDAGAEGAADVAAEVLAACAGIAEDLAQVLAGDDLDDDAEALQPLRDAVDEVTDLAVLLGIEGGPERAADAAALLAQLRGTFDRFVAAAAAHRDQAA
jgi:hypothetical protein